MRCQGYILWYVVFNPRDFLYCAFRECTSGVNGDPTPYHTTLLSATRNETGEAAKAQMKALLPDHSWRAFTSQHKLL